MDRTPVQSPPPRPVRRVTLTLPDDVGRALRARSLSEDRPAKVEAIRLLRSALAQELGDR